VAAFGWSLHALYGTRAGELATAGVAVGEAAPVYFAVSAGVPLALHWLRAVPDGRVGFVGLFVPGTVAVAAVTLGFWLGAGASAGVRWARARRRACCWSRPSRAVAWPGRTTARVNTVEVTDARILLPTNPDSTAALFTPHNPGPRADVLERVSSPDLGATTLARTQVTAGTGEMQAVASVTVPAGGSIRMSPDTLDVRVADPPTLKAGTRVRFDLWFHEEGRVRVAAVTVRPGS
jgi:copper(I)-binding protein